MSHAAMDDIDRAAWDKFRASVHAALEREATARLQAARPTVAGMPIFCDHKVRRWFTGDIAWVHCNRCGSSARSHPGDLGMPVLPPHVVGYTMPAAPHGTTMDVIDGGTL